MAKILCPCCFEQFDDSEVEYLCLNMSRSRPCSKAQGKEKIAASEINPKNPVCPECHQKLSTKVCPYCGFTLPYSIGTIDSYPISIIGAKESGKSNYVAVLIDELKNKVGGAFNCSLMATEIRQSLAIVSSFTIHCFATGSVSRVQTQAR